MTTPKILFVDDEPGNRLVFEEAFGERFAIVTADSGADALARLATNDEIGVILADQRMSGMTGNELLAQVKERNPAVVRIVVTAYADLDPVLEAVNQGLVARYVIKPWRANEIEEMLRWATQTYRLGIDDSTLQQRVMHVERLATLGTVAASVAHDLVTPISAVALNAARLAGLSRSSEALERLVAESSGTLAETHRENLGSLAAELPEIANDLRASAEHAHEVLKGICRLAKPGGTREAGEHGPETAIDLAVAMCRSQVHRAGGRLEVERFDSLPPPALGSTELAQVLINLLMNAAQALDELEAPGAARFVRLRVRACDGGIEIVVDDNGPGMAEHLLEAADRPLVSTRADGTGIGLPQCRRLVEGAGGTLDLSSEVGRGTSVRVWLPAADAAASESL